MTHHQRNAHDEEPARRMHIAPAGRLAAQRDRAVPTKEIESRR